MSKSESRAVLLPLLFVMGAGTVIWVTSKIIDYSKAHVTLMQTPCYSEFVRCSVFQYDLFGDGTVVYQNIGLSDAVTYRISRFEAINAIWRIDASAIRNGYWQGVGGPDTPSCIVLFRLSGGFVENVCGTPHIEYGDDIEPALLPLIKALWLDRDKPDYAPTPPKDVLVSPFTPSSKYIVEEVFWKPSPPPPLPEEVTQ